MTLKGFILFLTRPVLRVSADGTVKAEGFLHVLEHSLDLGQASCIGHAVRIGHADVQMSI